MTPAAPELPAPIRCPYRTPPLSAGRAEARLLCLGRMRPPLRFQPATPLLRCLRHLADALPRRLMPPGRGFAAPKLPCAKTPVFAHQMCFQRPSVCKIICFRTRNFVFAPRRPAGSRCVALPLNKLEGVASANPCPPSDTSEGGARAVRRGRDGAKRKVCEASSPTAISGSRRTPPASSFFRTGSTAHLMQAAGRAVEAKVLYISQ